MRAKTRILTVCEGAQSEDVGMLGQVRKCNIGPPLSYHEVHGNETLEDDCPR
jgi:hypothetical protein